MAGIRVIPVLDIKEGQVVHAIAGRRESYQPISSRLTHSCRPLDVALAIRDWLGLTEFYVADLDAITGATPSLDCFSQMSQAGLELAVDAGVKNRQVANQLTEAGVGRVVVGLETLPSLEALGDILAAIGRESVLFSVDLRRGEPVEQAVWPVGTDAFDIASDVVRHGVQSLIVLDLAQVGTATGTGTAPLCQKIRDAHENLEIIAGGGIRHIANVKEQETHGVSAVLVASALHNGNITCEDLQSLAVHS